MCKCYNEASQLVVTGIKISSFLVCWLLCMGFNNNFVFIINFVISNGIVTGVIYLLWVVNSLLTLWIYPAWKLFQDLILFVIVASVHPLIHECIHWWYLMYHVMYLLVFMYFFAIRVRVLTTGHSYRHSHFWELPSRSSREDISVQFCFKSSSLGRSEVRL